MVTCSKIFVFVISYFFSESVSRPYEAFIRTTLRLLANGGIGLGTRRVDVRRKNARTDGHLPVYYFANFRRCLRVLGTNSRSLADEELYARETVDSRLESGRGGERASAPRRHTTTQWRRDNARRPTENRRAARARRSRRPRPSRFIETRRDGRAAISYRLERSGTLPRPKSGRRRVS